MQTKTYKTRISILIMCILVIIPAICLVPLSQAPTPAQITVVSFVLLTIAIIIASIFSIKYVIDNDTLRIYTFFWMHTDIKIESIKKMEPSRCLLSSPAGSLKRLAIHYNKYDVVYISPRNQEDFINEINKRRDSKE